MKKYYQPDLVSEHIPLEPQGSEVCIQYLRPGQILAAQQAFPVAYQPLGTLEWHCRQNPIGCDALKADALCRAAAEKTGGLVMPPIYFAADAYRDMGKGIGLGMDSDAGFQLPGSFYQIDTHLLKKLLINACQNYLARGFEMVVLVSGHNAPLQQNVMDEVCYALKDSEGAQPVVCTMEYMVIEPGDPRRKSDHAGGYETSMMMHLHPDCVNPRANDGCAIRELSVYNAFPLDEASAQEGQIRFALQTEGLCRLVKTTWTKLKQK